jgi:hypothetical protein
LKIGAKISISPLAIPSLFPPFHNPSYSPLPNTPAVALIAKEQGREAGFTPREKKEWKGSPYEWCYQYSIEWFEIAILDGF